MTLRRKHSPSTQTGSRKKGQMPMQYWMFSTPSIGKPGTSSGGQLSRVFETPWGHATVSSSPTLPSPVTGVRGTLSAGGHDITFSGEMPYDEMLLRSLMHLMLFVMPGEG